MKIDLTKMQTKYMKKAAEAAAADTFKIPTKMMIIFPFFPIGYEFQVEFSEKSVALLVCELGTALEYLRKHCVIHR